MSGDVKVPKRRFKEFQGTDGWEKHKIKWLIDQNIICEPMDGNHGEKHPTASEYVDTGIPFLMASDISNGIVDLNNCKFITKKRAEKLDKGFAQNGDILLTHKATIGEVAILNGLNCEYAVLTPQVTYYRILDNLKLNPQYLYAFFNSEKFQTYIKIEATQSTRAYIGISAQHNLNICLPKSIQEQKKIGECFSKIDNLITLNQRKLKKLKALKKAYLTQMFPAKGESKPKLRFTGFNDEWEMNRLGDCTGYRRGSFPQPYGNPEWYGGDGAMPFVQIIDVTKDLMLAENTKQTISKSAQPFSIFVKKGSVIVTLQGSIGRVAITQYDAYFDRTILIFENYKYNMNNYFWAYTVQKKFDMEKKKAPGGTIKTITKEALSDFNITLPKRGEQDKIANFFSVLDNLITLHQRKIEKLQNLKKAYLNEMFI